MTVSRMETRTSFGARLEAWTHEQGMNLAQLAEQLGVAKGGLYRYPKEPDLLPKTLLLLKLAEYWPHLNIEWLLTGEGKPTWATETKVPKPETHYLKTQRYHRTAKELQATYDACNDAARSLLNIPVEHLLKEVLSDTERQLKDILKAEEALREGKV